jgi:hypothetical protein
MEMLSMPVTLARTISKVQLIPNSTNAQLVKEMYEYLKVVAHLTAINLML